MAWRCSAGAATMDDLDAAQVEVMGRKSAFGAAQKSLGSLDAEGRRTVGKLANEVRRQLQAALDERREALAGRRPRPRLLEADRIDLSLPGRRPRTGSLHPLTIVERQVVEVFVRASGFRVVEGPEIEDDWHNFEALNIPPDHPARTMKDTIYPAIPGRPDLVLRTETSAAQIRTMESQPPPVYIVSPGRVYRRETSDPTHLPVFHQVEGLVVDEGITFAHLKGTLESRGEGPVRRSPVASGSGRRTSRSWNPVPRSGCRASSATARAATCAATGGSSCSGSGMVHPKVLENCGYDSERYTGFAFGVGIERIALLRYAIPDMRMLVDNDVRFLAQFEGVA